MPNFDDSADEDLAAACNRLAAWVEPLPEGTLIDPASQLTERDLALILRHLYATRHVIEGEASRHENRTSSVGRASVPITARG
ncbi:MAG: hypothetical protein EOO77_20255 [Oxalobacteraceae bacterium]|nr:MAG: hypothetical protein EOO77_20255 [Oxalobacteraceae bacterium]